MQFNSHENMDNHTHTSIYKAPDTHQEITIQQQSTQGIRGTASSNGLHSDGRFLLSVCRPGCPPATFWLQHIYCRDKTHTATISFSWNEQSDSGSDWPFFFSLLSIHWAFHCPALQEAHSVRTVKLCQQSPKHKGCWDVSSNLNNKKHPPQESIFPSVR